ncbi:MAG TPA: iron-sulfur cluster assembly scaffold protein, partial [Spirochaetaceae bacterium]|nr:iron-sulfur cluster assembly scaffold protein [Spirochaetaceae bacterium]
ICECKNITDQQIDELVASQAVTTFEQLQAKTGLGSVCGKCKAKAEGLFAELRHIHGFV